MGEKMQNENFKSVTEKLEDYFRVGDKYFKIINQRDDGFKFVPRSRTLLIDLFKQENLKELPAFEGFTNEPGHGSDFKLVINGLLNTYKPTPCKPAEGDCSAIFQLVKHIFGDQYELGLDYLQLLYRKPKQLLPVLCLVSEENKTGKTTFGQFIGLLLGENFTVIGNSDFLSDFNGSYADKVCCMIDEGEIPNKSMFKLKYLSTSNSIQLRKMRTDHLMMPFYCKFILCSNNEEKLIAANKFDVRYWVHKIPQLEHEDPYFMNKLKEQLPHFIHFLLNREMYTENLSRMWFHESLLITKQLEKIRFASHDPEIIKFLTSLRDILGNLFEYNGNEIEPTNIFYISASDLGSYNNVTLSKIESLLNCGDNELYQYKQRRFQSYLDNTNRNNKSIGVTYAMLDAFLENNSAHQLPHHQLLPSVDAGITVPKPDYNSAESLGVASNNQGVNQEGPILKPSTDGENVSTFQVQQEQVLMPETSEGPTIESNVTPVFNS